MTIQHILCFLGHHYRDRRPQNPGKYPNVCRWCRIEKEPSTNIKHLIFAIILLAYSSIFAYTAIQSSSTLETLLFAIISTFTLVMSFITFIVSLDNS